MVACSLVWLCLPETQTEALQLMAVACPDPGWLELELERPVAWRAV